jgi:hypothetical protein
MKKTHLTLFILLLFCSAVFAQSVGKSKSYKPTNYQKKVTTIVSGKSRSYYSLSNEEVSRVSLRGPGKLRVITRARFMPDQKEDIGYEILYTIDGGEQKRIRMSSVERSKKATYVKGSHGVPAELKDFEIELGRGDHSIEFKLSKLDFQVAARYIFTATKPKKRDWIAYSPLQPSEPVDIVSRESSVGYYRFSNDKPLRVAVNGPSELRVLTRIENHYQMRGRIHYRIQVKENGEVINTYQLNSQRSEVAVYEDNKDLIPGKACEFVIVVPKGRHIYEILPLDKDKNTVLGRCLLPKNDVKLKN